MIKIGAKVISHGRYVAFQMAKVAIPRTLFANILRLIDELRPPPDPIGSAIMSSSKNHRRGTS